MGWGRYAESMRVSFLSPSLLFLQPTPSARRLARLLSQQAASHRWPAAERTAWEDLRVLGNGEAKALTFELMAPAHDAVTRIGASFRVLDVDCWPNGRLSLSTLPKRASRRNLRPAALHVGRWDGSGSGDRATEAAAKRAWAAALHFHRAAALDLDVWPAAAPPLPWRHRIERTLADPIMGRPLQWEGARAAVRAHRCNGTVPPTSDRVGLSRPLHYLVPPGSTEWPLGCGNGGDGMAANQSSRLALCDAVRAVAIDRVIMAAVANQNIATDAYLGRYTDLIMHTAKVRNFLVVALDERTGSYLRKRGVVHYIRRFKTRTGADSATTDNHATSALKFTILAELLSLGCSVLLTDVDVPIFRDPFHLLVRDSDVENMSDGWDDPSAYGFVHAVDLGGSAGADSAGPAGAPPPSRSLRYETRNSGLMYIAATHEGLHTVQLLADRMAKEAVWDQSAWNQETFRAAYGSLVAAGASVRVMNYLCVLNTKVVFKYLPHDPALSDPVRHTPTMAHMNYHPEKEPRMQATIALYRDHDLKALSAWNGGEGRRTGTCRHKVGVPSDAGGAPLSAADVSNHTLTRSLLSAARPWRWGSHRQTFATIGAAPIPIPAAAEGDGGMHMEGPVWFRASGVLESPWMNGTWGTVAGPWRRDSVHVHLGNETYLLMFLSEKWRFVGVRCHDEYVSYGRVEGAVPERRLVW